MIGHWHIATGLAGYGPDGADGYGTATDVHGLCLGIGEELRIAADAVGESAGIYRDHAKAHREAEDDRAELDALRDYLAANDLWDELTLQRAFFDADRANAPLYRDDPDLFETTILTAAAERFPMDLEGYSRLYVWPCEEPDECEHLDEEDE